MKTRYAILAIAIITIAAGCRSRQLNSAERHYRNESFVTAAQLYEGALRENPEKNDPEDMLRLADCYREMNRYAESEEWYRKAIHASEADRSDRLHYAEVLKAQGKCPEALAVLDEYLQDEPKDKMAQNMRQSCAAQASGSVEQSMDTLYATNKLELGFVGSAFSTSRMGDDLLVSANTSVLASGPVDQRTGNGFLDLYVLSPREREVQQSGTGQTLQLKEIHEEEEESVGGVASVTKAPAFDVSSLKGEINSEYHEGAAILSPDGSKMFFTRSKMKNKRPVKSLDNENHLELCMAERGEDGEWGEVESFEYNKPDHSMGHPAITPDGKRLFYISDMPGGEGGTDIYYSDLKENGEWGKPENAGKSINTAGDEMFPVIHADAEGKALLYFSSDGLPGAGSLDIFRSELNGNQPGEPVALGAPFNSTYDDFGILVNSDGVSGFFSSNRDNTEGRDNIYAFKRKPANFFVKAIVYYADSRQPIEEVNVDVRNAKSSEMATMQTDKKGTILFRADSLTKFDFEVRKEGYYNATATVTTPAFRGKLQDTTTVEIFMEEIVINKSVRLENIYYDFDKSFIRPDAAIELDKLVRFLNDNPKVKIELSSHCDARGSHAYNDRLSQRRAQSAVDYIISKGIDTDRMTARGYGETMLLNRCADGVICTEEEHQWNRRTEFKVTQMIMD